MFTNKRHSIRLRGYDYSSDGWYFVTICAQDREHLFGVVNDGKMVLNTCGTIVQNVLESLPDHHPVILDENQILPNHVHFVLGISSPRKGVARYAPTLGIITAGSLPSIVRSFKSECSKLIHVESSNIRVWQRNYYEHIIRNEKELNQIRQYIQDNPMNWEKDEENI